MPAPPQVTDRDEHGLVRDAFRELHADRLHGFALLVVLGDRGLAASLVADALDAGADRAPELRHPERAAAWLRRRVLRMARRRQPSGTATGADRRHALDLLGVAPAVQAAMARLDPRERAALVADSLERLDPRDVGTIVELEGAALARLLARARRRYVDAHVAAARGERVPDGPMVQAIRLLGERALR